MNLARVQHRGAGFTLVELMIVVAILGILAAVATPMILTSLPRYRLRAAARELVIDFKKARMEAVKRNRSVLLQFTLETVGNPEVGGTYQVCIDNDNDGVCNNGGSDTFLKTVTMPRDVRIRLPSIPPAPLPPFFASETTGDGLAVRVAGYNSRGLSSGNSNGASINLETSDGARKYTVKIFSSGGVRLE